MCCRSESSPGAFWRNRSMSASPPPGFPAQTRAGRAGHLPAQDTALAATALLGALHESLVGPLAPDNIEDPAKLRDAVQTVTLLALRAVGVMDARARGLVVQAVLPAKALVGA